MNNDQTLAMYQKIASESRSLYHSGESITDISFHLQTSQTFMSHN